jgi:hypothetical protein
MLEPDKEGEGVDLHVAWGQVAEHNVTGDLDILNIGWSVIVIGLRFQRLECAICLITVGNDQTIGAMVGLDDE